MRKRVQIALAVLLVAVGAVLAWEVFRFREPVYQGQPLSVWLESQASNGYLNTQTEAAIRQIGTNGIPTYLEMMAAKESRLKLRLKAHLPQRWLARFPAHRVENNRLLGAYGLRVLGPDAKHAVPALIALLNDKHPDVRYAAVFALRSLGPVARDALPSLIKCLKDPEFTVQSDAILGLGELHQQPEQVIPILVKLLDEPQNPQHSVIIRDNAIWSLRQFGAQAKPAVSKLVELLSDADEGIRSDATNALMATDPEAAAQAGVK